jgi:hypothetical protein
MVLQVPLMYFIHVPKPITSFVFPVCIWYLSLFLLALSSSKTSESFKFKFFHWPREPWLGISSSMELSGPASAPLSVTATFLLLLELQVHLLPKGLLFLWVFFHTPVLLPQPGTNPTRTVIGHPSLESWHIPYPGIYRYILSYTEFNSVCTMLVYNSG